MSHTVIPKGRKAGLQNSRYFCEGLGSECKRPSQNSQGLGESVDAWNGTGDGHPYSLASASTNLLSGTGLDKHDPLRTTCHNKGQ